MHLTYWKRSTSLSVAVLFAALGCDPAPGGDGGLSDAGTDAMTIVHPVISNILVAESPSSVLVYSVQFSTDIEASATVTVLAAGHDPWVVPTTTGPGVEHEVAVYGMYAETEYVFQIDATTPEGGAAQASSDPVTTAALPADLPPLDVTVHDAAAMAPGYTLFGIRRWNPGQDPAWGYLLALDAEGTVVWYLSVGHPSADLRQLANGNLLYNYGNIALSEITPDGTRVWDRQAPDVGTDTFHHEAFPVGDGTFVTLSTELRPISGYPDGSTHDVVADTVAVISADGSTLVREHSLFDILDPLRVRPGFDAAFWNVRYADVSSSTKDWTHGNAIIVDPADGNFIASLRHQDWLVKVDANTGALIWRFGEEGDFALEAGGDWQFHQHAPELQADGSLLIYDNGNARSTLGATEPPFTRVVQFEFDETAMTARQVWEYRGQAAYHSPFVGDADRLANGNVLITDGGLIVGCPDLSIATACGVAVPANQKWARIVEVTGDATPTEVMTISIRDTAAVDPVGYTVFRAERLNSLYGE